MRSAAEVVVDAFDLNHAHRAHVVSRQATRVRAEACDLRVRRVCKAEQREQNQIVMSDRQISDLKDRFEKNMSTLYMACV